MAANEKSKERKGAPSNISKHIRQRWNMQPDGHSLEAESALLINIDSVADDMSDMSA